MSEPPVESSVSSPFPVPPPIPVQSIPPTVPRPVSPVQPIPVQPISAEEPVAGFAADQHGGIRRRPGIVTAIAVISITVGSIGIITGGISGLYGGLLYTVSRFANASHATATTVVTPIQPSVAGGTTDYSGDDQRGLDPAARQIIVGELAQQRPLNAARKRQLEALLEKAGRDIFASGSGQVTPENIRASITQSGQLPDANDSDPNPGPDFFVITSGRIELSDRHAVYEPADHSQEAVRVSAPSPSDENNDTADQAPMPTGSNLSQRDLQSAMRIIDAQTTTRITPQQRNAIRAEFATGTGLLLPSTPGMPIQSQQPRVNLIGNGATLLTTTHGQMQIDSTGNVLSRMVYQMNFNGFGGNGKMFVSSGAAELIVAEAIISILLSIYLLVIGILTLRQTPGGRRLHIIYAILKIPLAILCGLAWCWLAGGFFRSLPNAAGGAPIQLVRLYLLLVVTGVAIIYPVGLLIAFRTPMVKRYYDSGQNNFV